MRQTQRGNQLPEEEHEDSQGSRRLSMFSCMFEHHIDLFPSQVAGVCVARCGRPFRARAAQADFMEAMVDLSKLKVSYHL
jgi:hypothetical protein